MKDVVEMVVVGQRVIKRTAAAQVAVKPLVIRQKAILFIAIVDMSNFKNCNLNSIAM